MARIVVCGYMIRHPLAGNLLAFFHYVLGLHLLGHEVLYLEESGWSESCYNPINRSYSDDPSVGIHAVETLINTYGVNATVCYVNRDTGTVYGADWQELKRMLKTADLLLNIGGVCWLPEFFLCKRRILIDMDPFFTQTGTFAAEGRNDYHAYFSYGVNIGKPDCRIPSDGIEWLPTVPPVVPEIWQRPVLTPEDCGEKWVDIPLTTVANWTAYGGIIYQGEHYGQKDEEFMRLLELPSYCAQKLELALSGKDTEIAEITKSLQTAGWLVRDGRVLSANVSTYINYLTSSRGEFSVAKNAYVKTRSGWFSDRSVCYLAASRPVILQDTGFSDWLPTGHGVLAFSCLESAVDCIERVNADYPAQSLAAREIAEQTFSYKVVLPRLLETAIHARDESGRVQVR
ncbi:hypothetical protein SAMD00079811_63530 [Scytonema sp. HK-05]|uniref:hypothetical protein n=1 Tax=Scytonema sp. HK-05 TaxID=1137095 RepID=UPI000936B2E4|nr:hypothetical protein [Scytonema sp. HK-05]OKH59087.1 hypothetical protein NIES2130_11085 [Scytonema sp. HK-05]BAY48727.1 hypothetical protein SAMD00079811_63530 [Scytonema sp. HK-05]